MPSEGVPKCQRCRRDHKKCSPENRQWPGPKCERCENYGYECSENMMARRSSQKEDLPRSMRGFIQELSQTKYFDCDQNVSRALTVRPPETPMLNSMQHTVQGESPWAGSFEYLRDIDWVNLSCTPVSPGSDPFTAMFTSPACPVPNLSATPLGRRQMYLEAFFQSQRMMQHSPPAVSSVSPQEMSINLLVAQSQRQYPNMAMAFSFEELAKTCSDYVRYGYYWNVFRISLQTDEVLLIDPCFSFDTVNPSTTFESAERLWLFPELGLKQFCQKLSGLCQMISDLARSRLNSIERAFLAAKIRDRLEEVLGPRQPPPSAALPSHPPSPTSFYPTFGFESSPVETVDGDLYSLTGSLGTEESDDGFSSLDGMAYPAVLGNTCLNGQAWGN